MPNALMPDTSSYADPSGNALLAKGYDPNAAMQSTIATMQGAQNLQRGQVALSSDQLDFARKHLAATDAVFGAIGTNPTQANIRARMGEALQAGVIDPATYQMGVQQTAGLGDDPNAIKQWALDHQSRNMSIDQQLAQMGAAPPQLVDVGDKKVPMVAQGGVNPRINVAGGPALQNGLAPGPASDQVTGPLDANGAPTVISRQKFAQQQGTPTVGGPAGAGGGPAGDPFTAAAAGQPPGQGGAPAAPTPAPVGSASPPGRQPPAPIQAPPAGQGAPMTVGLPPGAAEAAKVTAEAGAQQGVSLQKQADGAPVRKAMLSNLQDDLDKFTSGGGSDWQLLAKNWANRNVLPTSMQFDPQSIASQEAFNKQTTQLAQQQFAALGTTGTDSQLATNFKANPNQALSQLGNRQIIQLLQGNEDAIAAKAKAWQDWQGSGHGPQTYGQFQQSFNQTYNPRVYQAMYMDPAQVKDMQAHMTPAERQQFANDYVALKSKGYITPNTQRPAAPAASAPAAGTAAGPISFGGSGAAGQ